LLSLLTQPQLTLWALKSPNKIIGEGNSDNSFSRYFLVHLRDGGRYREHMVIVLWQETRIKNNTDIQFKTFSAYHCPGSVTDGLVHGGVAILVNNSFAYKSITLNSHLQVDR